MALQPGGYTDRPEDDNTSRAHPAFKRGKVKCLWARETVSFFIKEIDG